MAAENPWPMIHAERAALAEDLAITGRSAALAGLSGDGLATLRSRS